MLTTSSINANGNIAARVDTSSAWPVSLTLYAYYTPGYLGAQTG